MAVRLIRPGTIEEKIIHLQDSQKGLTADLILTDNAILKSLSKEDLLGLIGSAVCITKGALSVVRMFPIFFTMLSCKTPLKANESERWRARNILFTTKVVNIKIPPIFVEKTMGEFEESILLIVAIMNGRAYGIGIIEELEKRTDRSAAIGAVQTVLKRMEDKGWVTSQFGEATKERGGKRKRYYTITVEGKKVVDENRERRNRLWEAIPTPGLNYGSI